MMIKNFPELMIGPRLTLKKHVPELAQKMFSLIDSDRDRLKKFLPWVNATKTLDDSKNYISFISQAWVEGKMFDYGIFIQDEFVGCVGFHNLNWIHEVLEIGCWISQSYEGKGYLGEALKLLEEAAFENGFHRIEIRCSNKNERSANMAKRCGYLLDGVLRQNAIEHGQFRDTLVFSKLKNDIHVSDTLRQG